MAMKCCWHFYSVMHRLVQKNTTWIFNNALSCITIANLLQSSIFFDTVKWNCDAVSFFSLLNNGLEPPISLLHSNILLGFKKDFKMTAPEHFYRRIFFWIISKGWLWDRVQTMWTEIWGNFNPLPVPPVETFT